MALEKEDARLIAEALNKMTSKGSTGAPDARAGSLFDALSSPTKAFTGAIESSKEGLKNLGDAYNRIEKEMSAGIGTWRKLSDSGITFGNDVIGMGAAAAGTRMELGDFSDIVGKNSIYLAGFGGSINKGAEEFARTSKIMFDQYGETTDRLRQMGLTNKDLNETLALQASMIGNSMRKGEARDKIAIESATALATEMDLTAKLTGKSRQEQMEGAKKLQADAAFNIKLEQATRNMSEKEAAEYKTKVIAEFSKAEAMGLGQSFKETFAYGQVMSKQAANEQVMAGRAGIESSKAANAAAAGNIKEAAERNAEAFAEAAKNNKDASFQNIAMLNSFGGAAGEAGAKQYMANKALADNIELLKKDPENRNKTNAELFAIATENAKKEQDASAGATKSMVNAEQRFKDAGSVIQNSLVVPIQKDLNPALNKLADTVLNARSAFIPGAREKGNIAATEGELLEGRRRYEQKEPIRGASGVAAVGYQIAGVTGTAGNVAEKAVDGSVKVAGKLGDAVTPATNKPEPSPRSGGTYGAGKMFEDVGSILEITKPGEVVLNGEQQMNLAKGMMDKGAASAFTNLSKNLDFSKITAGMPSKIEMPKLEMPKLEMPKIDMPKMPSLDLNKISQDIKTTVSGGNASNIKLDSAALADMTKPFEKSFDEFGTNFNEVVAKMSSEIGTAVPTDMFDEFGTNFNEVVAKMNNDVADAMGSSNAEAAQARIDAAIAAKDAAYEKLQKLWNDGSDEELNANHEKYAEELRAAKENLNQVVAESMSDIVSNFDSFSSGWDESLEKVSADITDALPLDTIDQTADALEFASKRRQELEDIMNDGIARSSAEWDEIFDEAEQLDGQIEKLTNKQLDAFSKYADGWDESSDIMDRVVADISEAIPIDEFGDLEGAIAKQKYDNMGEFAGVDEAIAKQQSLSKASDELKTISPTASQGRGITMDSFTLGANGLPIAKPKSITAAVPEKKSEKSEAEQAEEKRGKMKAEMAKQGIDDSQSKEKAAGKSEKKATLDDVVTSLNALNTKMGQLISTTESGHKDVAKAAKSGSTNVYAR